MKYQYSDTDGETEVMLNNEIKGTLSGWPTKWSNGNIPHPESDYFDEFESILRQMSSLEERELMLHLVAGNVDKVGPYDAQS